MKSSSTVICIITITIILSVLSITNSQLVSTPSTTISWGDFFGCNVQFIWWNSSTIDAQVLYLATLGVQWIRGDIHWDLLEPSQDNFQWSLFDPVMEKYKPFKSIVYFVGCPQWASSYDSSSGQPFRDSYPPKNDTLYAERIVQLQQRYPWITIWEVWNEENLTPDFWAPTYNYTRYNQLFQTVSTIVNNRFPIAIGGFGYYGNTAGGGNMINDLAQSTNIFSSNNASYHPYTPDPEGDNTLPPNSQYNYIQTVKFINQGLNGKGVQHIWATEWGWSSLNQTETIQANNTVKRLLLDTVSGFNRTFLFTVADLDNRASSERDKYYGLIDLRLEKKPVLIWLERMLRQTGRVLQPFTNNYGSYDLIDITGVDQSQLVLLKFRKQDTNTNLFAFWSLNQTVSITLKFNHTTIPSIQPTQMVIGNLFQVIDERNKPIPQELKPNEFTLTSTFEVQLFEWPLIVDKPVVPPTSTTSTSNSSHLTLSIYNVIIIFSSVLLSLF